MKAILVMDMPKSCKECPMFHRYFVECPLVKRGLYDEIRERTRHENCPLKEMPKKKAPKSIPFDMKEKDYHHLGKIEGYNTCIDEILGEEE